MPKQKPNKSAAVRDYYKTHPLAKPKEVVVAMSKKGIRLTPQAVSTIRNNAIKTGKLSVAGRKSKKSTRTANAVRPTTTLDVSLDDLMAAKEFASKFDSVEQAANALNALQKVIA